MQQAVTPETQMGITGTVASLLKTRTFSVQTYPVHTALSFVREMTLRLESKPQTFIR